MNPIFTNVVVAMAVFSLTVATIIQVITVDMRYHRKGKAKRAGLILWMVVAGAMLNLPFFLQAIRGFD